MRNWPFRIVVVLAVVLAIATIFSVWQLQINDQQDSFINKTTLFQVAPYHTMAEGDYFGKITYSELAKYGDFGIGAFHGMNGEMIAINGTFYQIPVDGIPVTVELSETTPFAMVTYFEADQTFSIQETITYVELKNFIDSNIPNINGLYAVKIYGTFEYAQTRSVPLQTEPFPSLANVIANQTIFNLYDVEGTIAGYRCPSYLNGINVDGYHCHFITDDLMAGGHMLDFTAKNVLIEISHIQQYQVVQLP
jgi:acetolactate decarboxylase